MKSAARRRALVAVPVVALSVAGCSIHEQTQGWYAPANGVNSDAGDVGLRNVLVVADEDGQATVVASMSNEGTDDALVGVSVEGTEAEPEGGAVEIPSRGYASLGPDAERVDVQSDDAVPGQMVEVEFRFERAPRATVDALVRPAEGVYADALPEATQPPVATEDGETPGPTDEPVTDEPVTEENEPADDEPVADEPG